MTTRRGTTGRPAAAFGGQGGHGARWRARGTVALGVVVATLTVRWLIALGDTALPRPPLRPELWSGWWQSLDPLDAIASLAAVVAIGALGWLVLAATVHLVATSCSPRAGRFTAHLLPRTLAALVGAAVLGPAPLAAASPSPPPPPAVQVHRPASTPPVQVRLPASTPPVQVRLTEPSEPPSMVRAAPNPAPARQFTVGVGDNLWAIAERRVQMATGHSPTAAEVDPYWRALVEANRARLSDPDALEVGQVIDLPG